MKRLMPVKSHTMRAPLPFGFSTKKAGLIHSVGSVTGTMTPESITFLRVSWAACWRWMGICLAVSTLVGFTSPAKHIFIGFPFIGLIVSSSKTSGNSSAIFPMSLALSCVTALTGAGNVSVRILQRHHVLPTQQNLIPQGRRN
jgi:hypothetical protein